jgi:hypothetical protein
LLIWVASYPRSGNTLTRQILKQCFGADSYSIYHPSDAPGPVASVTGHVAFDGTAEQLVAAARESSAPWFVKTHRCEDVAETDKAIHVVRDGRAAMISFRRFQRDFNGVDFPIEQFALGAEPLESWARIVQWAFDRPSELTLTLRFEDLVAPDDGLLKRLSSFIGLPVQNAFDRSSFARLHKVQPKFFTSGKNEPGIEAMEKACPALFWLVNGEMMRALDYTERSRHWSIYLVRDAMAEAGRCVNRLRHEIKLLQDPPSKTTIDFA